jgi:hypothetical protein
VVTRIVEGAIADIEEDPQGVPHLLVRALWSETI